MKDTILYLKRGTQVIWLETYHSQKQRDEMMTQYEYIAINCKALGATSYGMCDFTHITIND